MKCIMIVGSLFLALVQINSTVISPNILLTFKTLTDYQQIEYSIESIEGSFSPLYISQLYASSLRIVQMNSPPGTYLRIDILFDYKNNDNCVDRFNIPVDMMNNTLGEYTNWEGHHQKLLFALSTNSSSFRFMQFYGCINSKLDDKLHNNQIYLYLFKNSEPIDIHVWNETFQVYSSILGYIKILNKAIEGNSDDENEAVFNDLTEYCHKIADISNKNYIPTFDDLYLDDNIETLWNGYTFHVVIILFFLMLMMIMSYFFKYVFRST